MLAQRISLEGPFVRLKKLIVVLLFMLAFGANFLFVESETDKSANLQAALLSVGFNEYFDVIGAEASNAEDLFMEQTKVSSPESPDLLVAQGNSLVAVSIPNTPNLQTLAILTGLEEDSYQEERDSIIEHEVQQGDTLSSIAKQFNISPDTLLWANNLQSNSKLKLGQKLVILPISGILHYVKANETLSQIAKTYKADANMVMAFNELDGSEIYIGDILIVPDGVMPAKSQQKKAPTISGSSVAQIPVANSYFIAPVASPYIITQGAHFHNAVDLGHSGGSVNTCGRPVYAAAGGTVSRASGVGAYNAGAGNLVTIMHPNGVVTAYFHLQSVLVGSGQAVSQGQQIGTIGRTGRSTGCHLHFEVRGATNPFLR